MEAHEHTTGLLEVTGLGCLRGERRLFGDVSFQLDPGGLAWIQGGNGSGKTTLMRTLCGLTPVMAGEVRWRGRLIQSQSEDYRRELIYIGHANGLKDDFSAQQNLCMAARLAGQPVDAEAATRALRDVGLTGREYLPLKFLSQGQRRRVALARLRLEPDRPLWLLDEPFNALDSQAVSDMQWLMERHLEGGGMIVLTTHQDVPIRARNVQTLRLASPGFHG